MTTENLIAFLRAAGSAGMSRTEFSVLYLGHSSASRLDRKDIYKALERIKTSLKRHNEALYSSRPGRADTRYVVVGATKVGDVAPVRASSIVLPTVSNTIPSVSRRVSGDLGLGATPGAMVSVARVSFLDGASA